MTIMCVCVCQQVQHQRGAQGGHAFAATLGERDDLDTVGGEQPPHIPPLVTPLKVGS